MLASAVLNARGAYEPSAVTLSHQKTADPVVPRSTTSFGGFAVANDNPRSTEYELAVRLASAHRELSLVSMHLAVEFRLGTMRQLVALLDPKTWEEGDSHLDVGSFKSFARAMAVLRPQIRPFLGLSDSGNILAMWGGEADRLSFEHFRDDELRWFVYSEGPKGRDSAAGRTTIDRIAPLIPAHGMDRLLYGQG